MPWKDICLIVIGAILGFASSILAEHIRRALDRRDRREYAKQMLLAVIKEIEEGIIRCKGLIQAMNENKISFSRIYVAFWDSMINEISQHIKDPEALKLLHSIYYRFDLINFNMEREKFEVGAAFANQYLTEIEENLSNLKARLGSSFNRVSVGSYV